MPWNEDISESLNYIYDAGLVQHLTRQYIGAKYMDESVKQAAPPAPFQPQHILGPLAILLTGLLASGAVLVYEIKLH